MGKKIKILGWIIGTPIILIGAIVLFISIWIYNASHLDLGRDKFNKEKWLANKGDDRCYMYKDLVKNHLKKGMSIDEVEDLLGKCSHVDYSDILHQKVLVYSGGECEKNLLEGAGKSMLVFIIFNVQEEMLDVINNHDKLVKHFKVSCNFENNTCDCYNKNPIKYRVPFENISKECGIEPW